MPELPEVETTRRGIAPHVVGHRVTDVVVRNKRLRWPIPTSLSRSLPGQTIHAVERRAKYLLLRADSGTVIIHLGMSGSLRVVRSDTPVQRHDHVDILFDNDRALRLTDPRRFGAVLWCTGDVASHELLCDLGPEPLSTALTGTYLFERAERRKGAIKQFIMDGKIVVGVGNIYASESLYLAGIHPERAAGRVSLARYEHLAAAIKEVLGAAIKAGGTTLRDFVGGDGKPGYFAQQLRVYGRTGEPCLQCGTPIRQIVTGQRSTYYCPHCQR